MGEVFERLDVGPSGWAHVRDEQPFRFAHRLAGHPLFTLDELGALADRLPPRSIETNRGDLPRVLAHARPSWDAPGRPSDLLRAAADGGRWLALHHIENDPTYRSMVQGFVAEFRRAVRASDADLYGVEAYVFVSSAHAVTPAHIDHEHNLFFQVRGCKRFTTGGYPDDDTRHRTIEAMYGGDYGATAFAPVAAVTHVLEPGDGLYVPPPAVHVVENEGELSISLSVVFHTPELDRRAKVYAFNAHLRRAGIDPRPPGQVAAVDTAKAVAVSGWRRAGNAAAEGVRRGRARVRRRAVAAPAA